MKLICETCQSWIGNFDPNDLSLPLMPEMFKPIVEAPSHRPPFNHLLTWEWFQCPICNKKPFYSPEKLLTDEGYIVVAPRAQESASEAVAENLGLLGSDPDYVGRLMELQPDTAPSPPKFVCPICGRDDFKKKVAMIGHMRTHKEK